jgi:hypothetical protein
MNHVIVEGLEEIKPFTMAEKRHLADPSVISAYLAENATELLEHATSQFERDFWTDFIQADADLQKVMLENEARNFIRSIEIQIRNRQHRWVEIYRQNIDELNFYLKYVTDWDLLGKLQNIKNDLFLEQSLPAGELEAGDLYSADSETAEEERPVALPSGKRLADNLKRVFPDLTEAEISAMIQTTPMVGTEGAEEDDYIEERQHTTLAIQQNMWQEKRPDLDEVREVRRAWRGINKAIRNAARRAYNEVLAMGVPQEVVHKNVSIRVVGKLGLKTAEALQDLLNKYDPQNVYLAVAPTFDDGLMPDDIFEEVKVPFEGTFQKWIEQFGLDILGEALEMDAVSLPADALAEITSRKVWKRLHYVGDLDLAEIEAICNRWRQEYLNMCQEKAPTLQHTRSYMEGYLLAIDTGSPRPDIAALEHARKTISPNGNHAYHKILGSVATPPKKLIAQAWKAFWSSGRIVGWSDKGLIFISDAKDEQQVAPWQYVHYKVLNRELYVRMKVREEETREQAERRYKVFRMQLAKLLLTRGGLKKEQFELLLPLDTPNLQVYN